MSIPPVPQKLISAITKNKCVVFVGAGLSVGAGLPTWVGLLQQIIQWCVDNDITVNHQSELPDLIDKKEFLSVAQHLEEALGENNLRDCLNSIFKNRDYSPTETHRLLPRLPFCAVLTSNFDRLLESVYTPERSATPKVITYTNADELIKLLGEEEFYILKTHGTIDDTKTVILGHKRFNQLIHGDIGKQYKEHLQHRLRSHTFFFVGFSLTDPDLLHLMNELLVSSNGQTLTHYALMDKSIDKDTKKPKLSNVEIERWTKDYNIKILPYETPNGDHQEVGEFLTALITEIEKSQHSNSLSRPQTHSQKIDSSISLPNVGVAEEFSNNQVANDSQKSLWQNQLGELATITSNIVSSNTDGIFRDLDQKIEPHQLISTPINNDVVVIKDHE